MRYFPAFLDIRGKSVLIVGGGTIAGRKIKLVLAAGGIPKVIAPEIHTDIAVRVRDADGSLHRRKFRDEDLDGVFMVFSATSDKKLSRHIYHLASARQIPVNSVDNKEMCSFIVPALVDRDPLVVAFSSGGEAPVLARRLRANTEAELPSNYGNLAVFLGGLRARVTKALPEEQRREFYEKLLDSPVPHLVLEDRRKEASQMATRLLKKHSKKLSGEVWLAGAGPGGAELLTLKTLRLMHLADVILYDRLVSRDILEMARRDADMIPVGKPGMAQSEINRLLVAEARKGRTVLRLKGGDPGIYGRLTEETDALKKAGITFHIAPGLTAALACAAYGGIPLTDRRFAHGVSFITLQTAGAESKNKSEPMLSEQTLQSLRALSGGEQTLVIYMGVELIELGIRELLKCGMPVSMPAMIVESVGFGDQRVIKCRLSRLPKLVREKKIKSPATFVIGHVCGAD